MWLPGLQCHGPPSWNAMCNRRVNMPMIIRDANVSYNSCQTGPWWHDFRQRNPRAIEGKHQRAIDARASGELWVSSLNKSLRYVLTQCLGSSVTRKSSHTSSTIELVLKSILFPSVPWKNFHRPVSSWKIPEEGSFAKIEMCVCDLSWRHIK